MGDVINPRRQTSKSGQSQGFRALFCYDVIKYSNKLLKPHKKIGFCNKVKLSITWSADNEKFNCI